MRCGAESNATPLAGELSVRCAQIWHVEVEDRARVVERLAFGLAEHEADTREVEERHARHLEQERNRQRISVERGGAGEVDGPHVDLSDPAKACESVRHVPARVRDDVTDRG